MIIIVSSGETIDTEAMTAEERHILQKLFAWKSLVDSVALFRQKTTDALNAGWNDSGPVAKSRNLGLVITHLEIQVRLRLNQTNLKQG